MEFIICKDSGAGGSRLATWLGWDWEDRGLNAQANSSQDPISKITRTKWTGGEVQEVENMRDKCDTLSSNPSPTKN
jgi:hypothetical protein